MWNKRKTLYDYFQPALTSIFKYKALKNKMGKIFQYVCDDKKTNLTGKHLESRQRERDRTTYNTIAGPK